MFTTKYSKNAPKPAKRRVKKYEDGGPVDEVDTATAEANAKPAESEAKKSSFDAKKFKDVQKAMGSARGDDSPKRKFSAVFEPTPFKTGY